MIMKKQNNSFWFKAVNFAICGLAIAGSIAGIAGMVLYGMLPEKAKAVNAVYNNITGAYSAQLVGQIIDGDTDNLDSVKNAASMEYTIVKSSDSDFDRAVESKDISYVYGSAALLKDYQYVHRYVDDGTGDTPDFNLVNVLSAMEYSNSYDYTLHDSYVYELSITQIALDINSAQFCVFAGDKVYLPKKVDVEYWNGKTETYVLSGEDYTNFYTGETLDSVKIEDWLDNNSLSTVMVYGSGNLASLVSVNTENIKTDDEGVPSEGYMTEGTTDVSMLAVYSDINRDKEELPDGYRLDGYQISTKEDTSSYTYYYVVSKVDTEAAKLGAGNNDYFAQADTLIDLMYNAGRYAWLIEIVSLVIFAVTAYFLARSAGRRTAGEEHDADQIYLRWIDKIPFGVLTGIMFILEGLFIAGAIVPFEFDMTNYVQLLLITFESAMAGLYIGLYYIGSIITRCKAHVFMRYTLWYYITRPVKKLFNRLKLNVELTRENTPLLKRLIGIFVIVFLAELFTIFIAVVSVFSSGSPVLIFLWLIVVKAVEFGVIIKLVMQFDLIRRGTKEIANGNTSYEIDSQTLYPVLKSHADDINSIKDGISLAVDQRMKSERMKTELITNVSHDIKTPLTSIINYVDLIKKEDIQDAKMKEYVDVLDRQSIRLKKLLEDLLEASKASTGNLDVNLEKMDVAILLNQLVGEYTEKLADRSLSLVMDTHGFEQVYIMADGRHIWRVFDNLLNNICKYAMEGTRVYIDILSQNPQDMNASNAAGLNVDNLDEQKESIYYNQAEAAEIGSDAQDEANKAAAHVSIVFKNISAIQLNISSDELMERFVRGDSSRNTEGSGLGLSIAQSLMKIMGGDMELEVDGDLFKATLRI